MSRWDNRDTLSAIIAGLITFVVAGSISRFWHAGFLLFSLSLAFLFQALLVAVRK